jgi:hypothetical protein
MENLKEKLTTLVIEVVDYIFVQGHSIADTKSGDITPDQEFELERIQKELTELLYQQIKQNL